MGRLFFLLYILSFGASAQTSQTFFIRNYAESLCISSHSEQLYQSLSNVNGVVEQASNLNLRNKYLYHAHEYDSELEMYFFPSRLYQPLSIRFFQPDPKSQYFSPYVFVNNDPVNFVDRDGKEGRALFLYEEVMNKGKFDDINGSVAGYKGELTDPYYRPVSDLMNGTITDIPEWNGRVHILSHASPNGFAVEQADDPDDFIMEGYDYDSENVGKLLRDPEDNSYILRADPDEFGVALHELSERQGVNVKSIHLNGCQSENAAKMYGKSYAEYASLNPENVGRRFTVGGVREGRSAFDNYSQGSDGATRNRLYFADSRSQQVENTDASSSDEFRLVQPEGASPQEMIEGQELREFVNEGRVPANTPSFRTTELEIGAVY